MRKMNIKFLLYAIIIFGLLFAHPPQISAQSDNKCSLPPAQESTLNKYAGKRGLDLGTFINECFGTPDEAACKNIIKTEFTGMTMPFDIPWNTMEPTQGTINYATFDTYVNFAKTNGLKLHYYHLLWDFNIQGYSELPNWLFPGRTAASCGTRSKTELESILKDHIQNIINRGGNTVTILNVVNEAFGDDGNLIRNCNYQILGSDYIDKAFLWTRQVAPNATLVLSDAFGRSGNTSRAKIDGELTYIKAAKMRGVPIDAIGIENHLQLPLSSDYISNLQYIMNKARDAGVKVIISEMDVTPSSETCCQDQIAQIYKQTVATCLNDSNCTSFYVFGISDKYSWLRAPVFQTIVGYAGAKPLLFDENYIHKPAYYGVMDALRENTTRACLGGAAAGDINTDGKVDIFDYNILVTNFGHPYTIYDYNNLVTNFGK